jgi:hypothetical protein
MKIIAKPPGEGKTTELIRMADKSDGRIKYILTCTHRNCIEISEMSGQMNIQIEFPITYDEFFSNPPGRKIDLLLLDDLDRWIFRKVRGVPIGAITFSTQKGYSAHFQNDEPL